MGLNKQEISNIHFKKSVSFLRPLLLDIQNDESQCYTQFQNNKNTTMFDFKKSFIMFTDIQAYRHISIMGIIKDFDRTLKYEILNSSILLDIWYNESKLISKDRLRTCDLLIIHGTNDKTNGFRKAAALCDLINTRKSYGKITWIFIHNTTPETYNRDQEGVLDEIKNVYQLQLKNKINLGAVLSKAKKLETIEIPEEIDEHIV